MDQTLVQMINDRKTYYQNLIDRAIKDKLNGKNFVSMDMLKMFQFEIEWCDWFLRQYSERREYR